jgi:hypothetical protein
MIGFGGLDKSVKVKMVVVENKVVIWNEHERLKVTKSRRKVSTCTTATAFSATSTISI